LLEKGNPPKKLSVKLKNITKGDNMDDKLYEILLKIPRKNLIHIMVEALDLMEQFNGRTKTYCICEAMGLEEKEDGGWKLRSIKKVKDYTEEVPFF
jgi:hypothetical protein